MQNADMELYDRRVYVCQFDGETNIPMGVYKLDLNNHPPPKDCTVLCDILKHRTGILSVDLRDMDEWSKLMSRGEEDEFVIYEQKILDYFREVMNKDSLISTKDKIQSDLCIFLTDIVMANSVDEKAVSVSEAALFCNERLVLQPLTSYGSPYAHYLETHENFVEEIRTPITPIFDFDDSSADESD